MMKIKKLLSVIIALCVLTTTFTHVSVLASVDSNNTEEPRYVENEMLISINNDEFDEFEVESEIVSTVEATLSSELNLNVSIESNCPINDTSNVYVVNLGDSENTNISILDLCSEINENCDNMYAEPNYIYELEESSLESGVSIEEFEPLFGINGRYSNWHLRDSFATEALNFCDKKGDDVLVAIIDSGCNINHEHLQNSLLSFTKGPDTYHGFNVTGQDFLNDITDRIGHGTAVASVVSGTNSTNNISGVAPNSKILPIKVCDSDEFDSYMIIEALRMIRRYNSGWFGKVEGADLRVSVINMSFSFEYYVDYKYDESAVKTAIDSMADEYVFVAAAGNQEKGTNLYSRYPASYDNVVGVMAYDSTRTMAYYSNYDTRGGSYYNIAAPGSDINVAAHFSNNGYAFGSGTSFASPIVAGSIALYMSNCPNTSIEKVKGDLLSSMTDKVKPYHENDVADGHSKLNIVNYLNKGLLNNNSIFSGSCGYDATWTYTHSNRSLVISGTDMIDDYTRGNAPWYRFRHLITTCEISDDISYIGDYSFIDLSSLINLDIGSGIENIGNLSFAYCKSLKQLSMPANEIYIAMGSFLGCSLLEEIDLPPSLFSPDSCSYLFQNCTSLTSITIPSGWTILPDGMFFGCTSLSSVTLPNTLQRIDAVAFKNCGALTNLTLPNNLVELRPRAFENCTGFTSLEMPRSLTKIKSSVFSGCTNLRDITIYDNITMMQSNIFNNCPNVTVKAYYNSMGLDYAQNKDINYTIMYRLNPIENSGIIFDRTNNSISNLPTDISTDTFLEQYVNLEDGFTLEYETETTGVVSVGTVINVLKGDIILETYTVI